MIKRFFSKYNDSILSNFIALILLSEFLTKVLILSHANFYRISTTIKLVFGLYLIISIVHFRLLKHQICKLIYFLFLSFIIGQLFMIFNKGLVIDDLLNNFFTFSTYSFLPLFAICVENGSVEKIIATNINIVKKVALINAPILVFCLFLPFEVFKSYPLSDRFGYNGLLGFSSSASFFYIAVLIIYYSTYFKERTLKNALIFIFHILISFIVGTKTIWFFIALLLVFHFCFLLKRPVTHYFRVILLLVVFLYFVFKEKVELFIVGLFSFGQSIYSEHGFLAVITSTRSLFLKEVMDNYVNNFSFSTLFFGGINVIKVRVEFEFVNMFIFFGLVGTLIYLSIVKNIFFSVGQKKVKTIILISLLVTCALSGGFFYSVFSACVFYLCYKYLDIINQKSTIF